METLDIIYKTITIGGAILAIALWFLIPNPKKGKNS